VLARLSKWLVVLMLTLSLGFHWAFLQSVAWVGMVVTYSQDSTLGEALSKTFDGKHPCKLCKAVQEGQKSEKKETALKLDIKKEFLCEAEITLLCPPTDFTLLPSFSHSVLNRTETPPVPPPRGSFI
jgi:hypothetical protein